MKQFLQTILALVVFTTTALQASADDFEVDNIYYFEVDGIYYDILKGRKSVEVIGVNRIHPNDIIIPAQVTFDLFGYGYPTTFDVTSIGDHAFYNHYWDLTSIEIPNSVTSIGEGAFYKCWGLTSIEIPNSVTSIGGGAFYKCSSLTSIEIPNSVSSIEPSTFDECASLTSIEIPNSVTSIGEGAFYNCSSLTSIEIPNSVTSIGEDAFKYCSSLTSIYYNSDVLVAINYFSFDAEAYEQTTLYLTEAGFAMSNDVSPWKYFVNKKIYDVSGINSIETDSSNAGVEYYHLNGVRANGDTLTPGLYIRKQGNSSAKVMIH